MRGIMKYKTLIYGSGEGVATLTMNRPKKMNAQDTILMQEMTAAIEGAREDDEVRVLIITGAGDAFCAGADLTAPAALIDPKQPGMNRRTRIEPFMSFGKMVKSLRGFHKPVIAAVNGYAVGGGLCIACLCDLRIASEHAKFGAVFVKRGLVADLGTTYLLPRIVGAEKALELMWTGEIIDAAEAQRIGLVGRVVLQEELMTTARELAARIAKGPSVAVELMKHLVYDGLEANNFSLQVAYEAWAQEVCYLTDDFKEGIDSFQKKKEAFFTGK